MTAGQVNPIIHAPVRLKICAFLSPLGEAEFQVIRDDLQVSDSVLSKDLKKLEDAGYVAFRKRKLNGRQRMWARLTKDGRAALTGHLGALTAILAAVD